MSLIHAEKLSSNQEIGEEIYNLIAELYPICRSITGDGVRKTLRVISEYIPLTINEVPTGTKVFDWAIPREWTIRDAFIKNSKGEKIVDFKVSNLHVLGYSIPVNKKVSLQELKEHLFTIPEYPDWIPYRTSYYNENWGFCVTHRQLLGLSDGEYKVFVDSSLKDGHLTYGEFLIKGEVDEEVLISSHICHPSLCNDNLSGVALTVFLAKYLSQMSPRYSYRFLFVPVTIGSITWLALNESEVSKIKHGLVAANLGDSGKFTYKKSRQGNAEIDQAVANILKHSGHAYEIIDFFPYGYDERQYCSPGFNLPVGCLMRTPNGLYPEYHTSADNLDFVQPKYLAESSSVYSEVLHVLEGNNRYANLNPKCEPQLGKRDLYEKIGEDSDNKTRQLAILWVLNQSDGNHSLLDISDKSGLEFSMIKDAAEVLTQQKLLESISD